jgi:hypothetical protein
MTAPLQAWVSQVSTVSNVSARGAGVLSGMSSSLLAAAQGKALKAGTESFASRGSALMSSVRDRLAAAGKGAGR